MNTVTLRAKKGGQIGANGEFYKGGQFINTVPENQKGTAKKVSKTNRVEVTPYNWVQAPAGANTILSRLDGISFACRETSFKAGDWAMDLDSINLQAIAHYNRNVDMEIALAEAFNSGYRFYKIIEGRLICKK